MKDKEKIPGTVCERANVCICISVFFSGDREKNIFWYRGDCELNMHRYLGKYDRPLITSWEKMRTLDYSYMAASCLTMLVCCLSTARWRAVCRFTFCRSILARPTWINSSATYRTEPNEKSAVLRKTRYKRDGNFFISKIFSRFFRGKATSLILYVLSDWEIFST